MTQRDQTNKLPSDPLEHLIRLVPFFRRIDRVDVARLIGVLEPVQVSLGSHVFLEGTDADALYLLEAGQVAVTIQTPQGEREVAVLDAPSHFGELGLLLTKRTASIRALTDIRTWKLPRERFEQLVRDRPALGLAVATELAETLDRRSREHVGAPVVVREPLPPVVARPRPTSPRQRLIGLVISVGVPAALWWATPSGLDPKAWRITAILVGAALGWLFEPMPDFAVALGMVAAWGALGLVSLHDTLAGFTTSSWLVALGALALAAAMVRSGLLFRTALLLLRIFPATHTGQVLGLLVGGTLITPLVPLGVARIAAVAPLGLELGQELGYQPRSRGMAALSFATLTGYFYLSSVFLTGFATNFFLLGLLPSAERARFHWWGWLAAAGPAGALMLIGAALVILLLFRPEARPRIAADVFQRQRRVLGSLAAIERVTIVAVLVLIAGLILQPVVHIDTPWLAAGALIVVLAGRSLDREQFRSGIDWGFLLMFGVLLGTSGVLQQSGIDRWIASGLMSMTAQIRDPALLLILLAWVVAASRLVLPRVPAALLLSSALVPAAPAVGISPWLAGFVILVMAQTWIVPNQGLEYLIVRDATHHQAFTDRQGALVGLALTLVRVAAIGACIPYWRWIGLLSR